MGIYSVRKKAISILALSFFLCFALSSQAQNPRYALVIGNGNYSDWGKLKNPLNDATDIATALKDLGFQVKLLTDANRKQMNQGLNDFHDKLAQEPASEGFFGMQGTEFNQREKITLSQWRLTFSVRQTSKTRLRMLGNSSRYSTTRIIA